MRYWSYSEPDMDVSVTLSENEILTSYFPIWYGLMAKAGKDIEGFFSSQPSAQSISDSFKPTPITEDQI